jgi:putative SOS response-associated peptidase YedK
MCIHFTSNPTSDWVGGFWGNGHAGPAPHEVWPHQQAAIVTDTGKGPIGQSAAFGLVPFWTKVRTKSATMNARAETVAKLPSYREPWRKSQRCLVPMTRFFEPCYESGRAVETAIGRVDGEPFTAAGIYDYWTDRATGDHLLSFSMLTINAAACPLMSRMHKPKDEKRSLVVIEPGEREYWLKSSEPAAAFGLLRLMQTDAYTVLTPQTPL